MVQREAKKILNHLIQAGGQVYYTGGCVRDQLLDKPVKDLDVVVFRLEAETLRGVLAEFGEVLYYGKSFPIYQLRGLPIEFSLPRGDPHNSRRAPVVTGGIKALLEADARHRDYTVNALYRNALTGELSDPLGGLTDMENGRLSIVAPTALQEDPLRVCRGIQLASRLGLEPDAMTLQAMRDASLESVATERVILEWHKWLMAEDPVRGWNLMIRTRHLPAIFSQEDTVDPLVTTVVPAVLQAAAQRRGEVNDPLSFMWAVLLASLALVGPDKRTSVVAWFENISRHLALTKRIDGLLQCAAEFAEKTRRRSDVARLTLMTDSQDLVMTMEVLTPLWEHVQWQEQIVQSLRRFRNWMPKEPVKRLVRGRDLKTLGYPSDHRMAAWLEIAFQLQLEGVSRDIILKYFRHHADVLHGIQRDETGR